MRLFLNSIIRTDPRQLINRLRYILRRKVRTQNSIIYRNKLIRKADHEFSVSKSFDTDSFFHMVKAIHKREEKEYIITFLNESRTFQIPFEWNQDELNRGTRLWKLNLHYMEYLSEVSDYDFQLIVNDWIRSNPPYMKDYALDNWNSYALSIRVAVWMQEYTRRHERLNGDFKNRMLNSLYQQIIFLYENPELDIGGNHIIKNIKAMLWGSSFFISKYSSKWLLKAEQFLEKELDVQILEDGMHYELSPSYHCQVFMDLLDCYGMLHNHELKTQLFREMSKMSQVIADLSLADGYMAQFSDGGYHMAPPPDVCLTRWKNISGKAVKQRQYFMLPQGGYCGMHSNDIDIVIDSGKIGADSLPAHGHGDIFSFELCVSGKRLVIDTGVYEYNSGVKRAYSRSTKAHNTVTLNNNDQGEFYSSFRLGRRANVNIIDFNYHDSGFTFTALHDGFTRLEGAPIHRRSFNTVGRQIVIEDQITEGDSQIVTSRLLINPDCKLTSENNSVYISSSTSELKLLTSFPLRIVEASWFPDFGVELPCYQIEIEYGSAPCKGEFIIEILDSKQLSSEEVKVSETTLI